jgi:hypothetical protein
MAVTKEGRRSDRFYPLLCISKYKIIFFLIGNPLPHPKKTLPSNIFPQ